MNSDAASEKRRRSRQYNREQRDRGDRSDEIKEDKRTESRHQFCPCHGRRMSRCPAEFADVDLFCDKGKFHREVVKPIADLKQGIVFANDVADCDELIPQLDFLRQTGGCTITWAYQMIVIFRYHNCKDTWRDLQEAGAIPRVDEGAATGVPNWDLVEETLADRMDQGLKVFGGLFLPPVATHLKDGARWIDTSTLSPSARDARAMRLLWYSCPQALQQYQAEPSRDAFLKFFNEWGPHVKELLRGVLGTYLQKTVLDVLVLSQWIAQAHVAAWPTLCPGYMKGYKRYFPGAPAKLRLKILHYTHRRLWKVQKKIKFPESCGQLCWNVRRADGRLTDKVTKKMKKQSAKAMKKKSAKAMKMQSAKAK
jgi:hypothetical protein